MVNYLLTKRGCPHCRNTMKVINKLNWRLPVDKRIIIVDCFAWEEFKIDYPPIMRKFEKDGSLEGYPHLYLSGIQVEPAPTNEILKVFLEEFFKNDFIY